MRSYKNEGEINRTPQADIIEFSELVSISDSVVYHFYCYPVILPIKVDWQLSLCIDGCLPYVEWIFFKDE